MNEWNVEGKKFSDFWCKDKRDTVSAVEIEWVGGVYEAVVAQFGLGWRLKDKYCG